jgi:hypothetical protein
MANPEHVAILKQGVEVWNKWREENRDIKPDISMAELSDLTLSGANFGGTSLHGVNLQRSNLIGAAFGEFQMTDGMWRSGFTNLWGADLRNTNLSLAKFVDGRLTRADLRGALLFRTQFWHVNMDEIKFNDAVIGRAIFGDVDLKTVIGLEQVKHIAPSIIGFDTLIKSGSKIPKHFLLGCGMPELIITYIKSWTDTALEYFSTFISHSNKDEDFARHLRSDLLNNGVSCYYAPEDMKTGERIRTGIDEAIWKYDKLLLILSEHSVNSDWVEQEVETAMERENEQGGTVLFSIRVDEAVMEEKAGWAAHIRRTRNIGDFTYWKDYDKYQAAFERLLRDLKMSDV